MSLRLRIMNRRCSIALACSAIFLLSGCTVGPNYKRPTAPVAAKWDLTEPFREADPKDAVPKTAWWTIFHDDDLNGLETELLLRIRL
jgi:outer membrane protein TolC